MASLNFSAANVDSTSDFEPLPAGDYEMMIIESDIAPNKKGTGKYIKLVLSSIEEESAGRRVYEYINFEHPNEKVVQIAERQLAELCNACGVLEITDTAELHDIPIKVRLAIQAGNEQFGPSNRVKKFMEV